MPTKRKGLVKAAPLALPDVGQDSAERKRVLNVLAQRRYRQKRKEHLHKLEAQVVAVEVDQHVPNFQLSSLPTELDFDSAPQWDPNPMASAIARFDCLDAEMISASEDVLTAVAQNQNGWDSSILLPSLPSTPLSPSKHSSSSESDPWDEISLEMAQQTSAESTTTLPHVQASGEHKIYSFPDEMYLEMPELTMLRGCINIAKRLNLQDIIWSLAAQSPFTSPELTLEGLVDLPANLQPTLLQMTIPHHPVVDVLPWPLVRDRMIEVLAQPPEFRPPGASSDLALVDFVYDLEDGAEGVRISGDDPYSEHNWEVGEKVFRSWWWMFDRKIIKRSNELRAARGAPMLGSILGEVG